MRNITGASCTVKILNGLFTIYSFVSMVSRRSALLFLIILLFPTSAVVAAVATAPNGTHTAALNLDPVVHEGYQHFYNLDYDGAIARFAKVQLAHPDDPMAVVYVLDATLFRELNRLDLLDTTLYAHEGFLTSKHTVTEDKDAKSRINELADRAVQLASDRLKSDPKDVEALYARGYARSLKATYAGLVQRAFVSGLHLALQARADHEKVLQLDSEFVDAKMVVGIHEYVVGTLPSPIKIMAGMLGAGGSKAKGMLLLQDCAKRGIITSVESRTTLTLFLRHDGRYNEAIEVAESLSTEYPRDFLFRLEEANLLKDSGQGEKAIASYESLLEQAKKPGTFQSAHIQLALFGLGETLRGQRDYAKAANAYLQVMEQPNVSADLKHRAQLGAGEMYDLSGQRRRATEQYQALLMEDPSAPQADAARKLLRSQYVGP
jgi:tetratricopeptide (TPR) repeat protein